MNLRAAVLFLFGPAFVSVVVAQPLEVVGNKTHVMLRNTASFPVMGVRIGDVSVGDLSAKEKRSLEGVDAKMPIHGRFALDSWGTALQNIDPSWAPYHLRTAGHLLDAVSPGPAGQPDDAANIQALFSVDARTIEAWPMTSPIQIALLARATEFAPVALLGRLLTSVAPDAAPSSLPSAYAVLPTATDALRRAIERHGVEALPIVLGHKKWSHDRGFVDPRLALAFDAIRNRVAGVLTTLTDALVVPQRMTLVRQLVEAFERGDHSEATRLGLVLIFDGTTIRTHFESGVEQRLICAALDRGAQTAMKHHRWLAAYAFASLAVGPCGESPAIRSRIAELFRHRGDEAFERLRLTDALAWFEGGFWFAGEAADRVRLADTNAELAILRFREDKIPQANTFLESARVFDPLRPRVIEAGRFKPTSSPRARFGVLVIILFLGFYAIRRLKRALVGDLNRGN